MRKSREILRIFNVKCCDLSIFLGLVLCEMLDIVVVLI